MMTMEMFANPMESKDIQQSRLSYQEAKARELCTIVKDLLDVLRIGGLD